MSSNVQADENERSNPVHEGSTQRIAGVAFVLAGLAVLASFGLAMTGPTHENPVFVYLHAGLFLATVFTAIGVTAAIYAVGIHRSGLAGMLGAAFTWLAVGAGLFWLMIAWMAGSAAASGSESLGDLLTILSPMGTGMFAVTGCFVLVGLGATAVGLRNAAIVHRVLSGVGVLAGVVGAVLFGALALVIDPSLLEALILLIVLAWLWTIPLGIALFRGGHTALEDEAGDTTSA